MSEEIKIWKVLKSQVEYQEALARTLEIFHAEENSPEDDELGLLLVLVKDYEDRNIHIPSPDPLKVIRLKMAEKGLKMKDLEPIIGSKGHVSSVLSGKKELTLRMVKRLHSFLGIPAEVFINDDASTREQLYKLAAEGSSFNLLHEQEMDYIKKTKKKRNS